MGRGGYGAASVKAVPDQVPVRFKVCIASPTALWGGPALGYNFLEVRVNA
jgi:hypothetical protein